MIENIVGYKTSLNKALKDKKNIESTMQAINNEIDNMETRKVMKPVRYSDIPIKYRKNIIDLHMFLKDKFKADGSFDKKKGRMVFNGKLQNVADVGDAASPTVNPISLMTLLQYAATYRKHIISTIDFDYAFLLKSIPKHKRVYVRVPKAVAALWGERYPYI
jgi:hypothetical protein